MKKTNKLLATFQEILLFRQINTTLIMFLILISFHYKKLLILLKFVMSSLSAKTKINLSISKLEASVHW